MVVGTDHHAAAVRVDLAFGVLLAGDTVVVLATDELDVEDVVDLYVVREEELNGV